MNRCPVDGDVRVVGAEEVAAAAHHERVPRGDAVRQRRAQADRVRVAVEREPRERHHRVDRVVGVGGVDEVLAAADRPGAPRGIDDRVRDRVVRVEDGVVGPHRGPGRRVAGNRGRHRAGPLERVAEWRRDHRAEPVPAEDTARRARRHGRPRDDGAQVRRLELRHGHLAVEAVGDRPEEGNGAAGLRVRRHGRGEARDRVRGRAGVQLRDLDRLTVGGGDVEEVAVEPRRAHDRRGLHRAAHRLDGEERGRLAG